MKAPRSRRAPRFWIGVALMTTSFSVYLAYPAIPFLPLPLRAQVAVGIAGSLVSWTMFFAGSMLAGREGREWIRRRFSRSSPSE